MSVPISAMQEHFSSVAPLYSDLRTVDINPILFIRDRLEHFNTIEAADIGCGPGRYGVELVKLLGERLHLVCIDINDAMLDELKRNVALHGIPNIEAVKASAMRLPLRTGSMDAVLTFNAIHHFNLEGFLREASRTLKPNRHLFIYTRLRSQNARSIWGRFFPGFSDKERRLYKLDELEESIARAPALKLTAVEYFEREKSETLEELVSKAVHRHYSTFNLYGKEEFEMALEGFKRNIHRHYKDPKRISWVAENTMLVARKERRLSRSPSDSKPSLNAVNAARTPRPQAPPSTPIRP